MQRKRLISLLMVFAIANVEALTEYRVIREITMNPTI